jgi:hypothetical protein
VLTDHALFRNKESGVNDIGKYFMTPTLHVGDSARKGIDLVEGLVLAHCKECRSVEREKSMKEFETMQHERKAPFY